MKNTIDLVLATGRIARGQPAPLHARLLIADDVLQEVSLGGTHAKTGLPHYQLVLAGHTLSWLLIEARKRLPPPKPPAKVPPLGRLPRGGPL